jgi:hypothetical protein
MAEATPENVLGDFDNAEFTAHGVTTRFYRDGDAFRVDTDGPDGKPASYSIAYTFGWTPLQQYLIRFPGGRLQALGIAWDARPADQGGQRWFHLYPDEADYGPTTRCTEPTATRPGTTSAPSATPPICTKATT